MKKIFSIFIFALAFNVPVFAQTDMLNTVNMINNTMLMVAASEQQNQQQAQAQATPIVVNIQYDSEGKMVVTSPNAEVKYQSEMPTQANQVVPVEDHKTGEIFLAFIFGCFVGWIIMKIFSPIK